MRPEQLALDLSLRPAQGREDFVVTTANAAAVAAIADDALRAGGKLALTGPEASGKTHLVSVWAAQADTLVLAARDLPRLDVPTLARAGRIAVEDVPAIAGQRRAEAALFHLHNRLLPEGGRLLLTGRPAPGEWGIALPDLASRIVAAQHARLEAPDDDLLAALLEKQFADRNVAVDPRLIPYLLTHMTRSAAAARALAEELNRLSLARRRPITIPLAREALLRRDGTSPD